MIGAHLSKSTLTNQINLTESEIAQIFISNPRSYQPPSRADVEQVNQVQIPLVAHLPYLVNIPSFNPEVIAKSSGLLLSTDKVIKGNLTTMVVHAGQGGKESSTEEAVEKWIQFYKTAEIKNTLLIENTAGGNAAPGKSLEVLVNLILALREFNPVGICFDTCHAYAAGYEDLLGAYLYIKEKLGQVDLVHLNDSKDPLGSNRDRHELLNKGTIGKANLDLLITQLKADGTKVILETPGDNDIWREEISTFRAQ